MTADFCFNLKSNQTAKHVAYFNNLHLQSTIWFTNSHVSDFEELKKIIITFSQNVPNKTITGLLQMLFVLIFKLDLKTLILLQHNHCPVGDGTSIHIPLPFHIIHIISFTKI